MPDDPLKDLKRLGVEAMEPCVVCKRQLLATDTPIFYRMWVAQCGLDADEIKRHVGLANFMGGGKDGLVLAGVMGPAVKAVVVMSESGVVNVCHSCAQKHGIDLVAMVAIETKPGGAT